MDAKTFIELTKEVEELEKKLIEARNRLDLGMKELGVGFMCQDPFSFTVFKISKPKGKFVYFADIEYLRTAHPGEDRGSLSKKEAESAGFVLKK